MTTTNPYLGCLGVVLAVVFFGTTYVPAKQYPTYDGMVFQWYMCSGILAVGLMWGLISNEWSYIAEKGMFMFPGGLLGGCLFAIANLLIPTVVNTLGLGVGFMLWNGANITMGYVVSRYGLFGVDPTIPTYPRISELGILFMIGSILVYGKIQPTLSSSASVQLENQSSTEAKPLIDKSSPASSTSSALDLDVPALRRESLAQSLMHPELPNYGPFTIPNERVEVVEDGSDEKKRRVVGIALALFVGCLLGNCLTPYVLWQQACNQAGKDCDPLNFLFSQCMGIYITSTIAFLLYSTVHRIRKRRMPRSALRPAYVSGLLWATGLAGQLLSAGNLGFDLVYPLTAIGPAMVSMLWSAVYFKEIEGRRNMCILAAGTCMIFIGTALRVYAS
ncbi:hypothetical protein SDRG_03748 [Saprolegnia diclina VS20]|uniref:EamA domain-containing protein n=1 Tax=Saprolegnia diclina (strain VS20) TaxID=1156394 RepID=T0QL41_SAPDV|nr:hypothetical protein SDRG_03748 [Saprolegnia diclina VS20]EQC38789.1 hypothetical protein SDRG_03748 [Saprolegnia diclina VS20]|eukprot:XP_008607613.1 hypothetical protein SDRG_03748 [Saprolegnia diclina VS20]